MTTMFVGNGLLVVLLCGIIGNYSLFSFAALDLGTNALLGVPFTGLSLVHTKERDGVFGLLFLAKYVRPDIDIPWPPILHVY